MKLSDEVKDLLLFFAFLNSIAGAVIFWMWVLDKAFK